MSEPRPIHRELSRPLPRALVALAIAIAGIEIVLALADRGVLGDASLRGRVLAAGAFWVELLHDTPPLFAAQPWTMFVSHALLHGSLLHMAMNLTILLALGRFAADRYGPGVVLPLFLAGAVAGGAVFAAFGATPFPMVGASGAVFAFLGLWIAWDWRRHREARRSAGPVWRRVATLAALNAGTWVALGGMLAWEAHLGGFVAGLIAGFWLEARGSRAARAHRAAARRSR